MTLGKSNACKTYGPLVARVALALLFIVSGINILMNLSGTAGYYASIGIPLAMAAAVVVMLVKIVGALMVALGIHAREGALALLLFTIVATLVGHIGEGQLIPALKNVAIMGGFVLLMLQGSGKYSLHKHCPCPKCKAKLAGGAGESHEGHDHN